MNVMMSLIGVVTLLSIAVFLSVDRKAIDLRTVGGAFALQFGFAILVLYVPAGQELLKGFSDGVSTVIQFANDGIRFMFGDLAQFKVGFIFAVHVLPVIIFFSSLTAVLYHLGVMQLLIRVLGGGLQKVLGTSKTESMSATANIFVSQTEAPLVVKPYIATLTRSELFAIMTGGMASIAGSVLAGYAQMGVPIEFLVSASFMAAPGGLLMAKLMYPETEKAKDISEIEEQDSAANFVDAAASGATAGLTLALNVGAMLIAFTGLIALANGMLGGIGHMFDYEGLSLQLIFGWLFAPIAFLIGVPWGEAIAAGSLIGQKIVFNEFIAFQSLSLYLKDITEGGILIEQTGQPMSERTRVIVSYALCGFANFGSIAILLGGLGALAPNRRHDIAVLGIKAVIAGSLSNLMSGTLAGLILALG